MEAIVTAVPHEDISRRIIGAAMHVYNKLGSGFNEELYDRAMRVALEMQGLGFESQKTVEIYFEGAAVGLYYLDFLVEGKVVVELKALPELNSSHLAQTITYLAGTGCQIGLLINFGTSELKWRRVFPPRHVQAQPQHLTRRQGS
jgi:GxxExxY protein